MTNEEKKTKRIEFIQEMIFKYTTIEPILTPEEIAFAVIFHTDSDEIQKKLTKALLKEAKSKW